LSTNVLGQGVVGRLHGQISKVAPATANGTAAQCAQ
jgi:hypothetical protein